MMKARMQQKPTKERMLIRFSCFATWCYHHWQFIKRHMETPFQVLVQKKNGSKEATRNPGIATSSKDATSSSWPYC